MTREPAPPGPEPRSSPEPRSGPEPRSAYPRHVALGTRWGDNDVYGHVNNVVYYAFFDTTVNGCLIASGVLDIAASPVIGLVVETGCRYFAPIAFPDRVTAGVRVAHLGRSSVRYEIGLFREDDDRAAAQGHFVHVYVDRESRRPVALPAPLRRALAGLVPGATT
ncbi:acyl-CoA thioesterase [Methylobacterium planeticum]|uniref:Acyl-CoA thioesterase n=1 Tax=Methylobacterium planeticum TaxID=2615211 RepID=A0A6N6MSH4_9HYPH|nr:thioesterase family protein [Methylobacterium planeticum]KAB1074241.1 acyl-CoA thioesterase [Methylobacterium planeticum]